jgi:hypothetical protein
MPHHIDGHGQLTIGITAVDDAGNESVLRAFSLSTFYLLPRQTLWLDIVLGQDFFVSKIILDISKTE